MNESAGDQVTELRKNDLHLTDPDNLDATDDADEEPPVRRAREGLPGSFRMRHDAHYVDELMSRTDSSPVFEPDNRRQELVEAAPSPGRPDQPVAVVSPAGSPAAAAALSLITGRLESLVTHSDAVRAHQATPPLIAHSVQTEFARVARLARAAAILQERAAPVRRSLSARDLADRVMTAVAPVARMGGLACAITVDDPAFVILADSSLIQQGLAGTVDAVVDLVLADPRWPGRDYSDDPAPGVSIRLQSVTVRPALIVDVICPLLVVGARQAERFFDNADEDYRMAPAAGILFAAAAYVARAHGGRADVTPHSGAGATITLVFPQSAA